MFVTISKYPRGANLEASAYFRDNIKNKWPRQANIPIKANNDHWLKVGLIQTTGTKKEATTAPTTPVNNKVNKGLSELCNLRVIIR